MTSVFVSHSGGDAAKAQSVADRLREAGLRPVLDGETLRPGADFVRFMDAGISTSDYFLLLWSAEAADRKWVRAEWQAALTRAIDEERAFLVVGRLDEHELPVLLRPRLYVVLHPRMTPGVEELVQLWRRDEGAQSESHRPAASNGHLREASPGEEIYVTSELFGVTVPIRVDRSAPTGVLLNRVVDDLSLPTVWEHRGRVGIRFDYSLLVDGVALEPSESLESQHVDAGTVLWLESALHPTTATAARSGELGSATFRGRSDPTSAARHMARRALVRSIGEAGLGRVRRLPVS